MGTRNLTCVMLDGQFKLSQYGQWDGYPTGQGQTIVDFLKEKFNKEKFVSQINRLHMLTPEQVQWRWKQAGADDSGYVNMEVSDKFKAKNAHLNRDIGAGILEYIQEASTPESLPPDLDFAADSLFCEFLYILNLDSNELEIYKGFNREPLAENERFYFLQDKAKDGYYPVRLMRKWKFEELTPNTMKELEDEMNKDRE